jgi:hypothetical protein
MAPFFLSNTLFFLMENKKIGPLLPLQHALPPPELTNIILCYENELNKLMKIKNI